MITLKDIVDRIPERLHRLLRRLYYLPAELSDRLSGKFNADLPPRRLHFVGPGDFEAIGRHMVQLLITHGKLAPDDTVLDIGCGVGRLALPLSKFLSPVGRYTGFDIVEEAISWCKTNIQTKHPNFNFHHVDIFNKNYNARGKIRASEYRFNYGDEQFDFVFATSLFTHLKEEDIAQYIGEMARVMRPGARCFCTFFLLQPQALKCIEAGESYLAFKHQGQHARYENPGMPEQAIAFDENYIRALFHKNKLEIEMPIQYGQWAKHPSPLSLQDIVIAVKGKY